ncbi:MAG: helix-turn-helix domain-containing protein [archaeon]
MWLLELKIKHDCVIGNRCEKFSCETFSLPLTQWTEDNYEYVIGQHALIGDRKNVNLFIRDLRKDPSVFKLERKGNVVCVLEGHKGLKIPARIYNQKIFFIKPVFIDKKGYEHWEMASFEKETLLDYLDELKKQKSIRFELKKITKSKLESVFVTKVMPMLTEKQEKAFELALNEGYYVFPRKIGLKGLAKLSRISLSSFQECLRRAEAKIIPSFK